MFGELGNGGGGGAGQPADEFVVAALATHDIMAARAVARAAHAAARAANAVGATEYPSADVGSRLAMMGAFRRGATRPLPDRDLDRLAERFGALLVVRFGIALTVLVVATLAPSVIGIAVEVVAPVTGAYMVFAVLAEVARRRGKWSIDIQSVMQLVDVAYIALIMAPTGGPRSQLVFLFYVHLIAVTLLGNHRTGVRMALIDSLVFVLLYTFSLNTQVSRLLGGPGSPASQPPTSAVVLSILAFWLVAGCTSFYSWVNERELRRSTDELKGLAEMSAALERTTCPEEIMQVLLARSVEAFGFARGAVLLGLPDGTTAMSTVPSNPASRSTIRAEPVRPDVVVERAWAEHGPVLVRALDPILDATLDRLLPNARNVVVLPLTAEGEPLGALAVERGGPFGVKLPVRAVTMLNQFAANAAMAVRNAPTDRRGGTVGQRGRADGPGQPPRRSKMSWPGRSPGRAGPTNH